MTSQVPKHDNEAVISLIAVSFALADPLTLDIGIKGKVMAPMGLSDTRSGQPVKASDVAVAARNVRFVFVGESHNNPDHHKAQADVIQVLVDDGRDVSVGFEMFTRDNQENINGWSMGWWTDEEFIAKSDWKKQWGFSYALYKPIFDTIKKNGLPMAALNVPRDWVRQVGKTGPSAITEDKKAWVPELYLGNKDHRAIFDSLMGGHPMPGIDNVYAAQVTWDTGMAQSALDFMADTKSKKAVMVVCAGVGHVMYGQGINWRLRRKTGENVINVSCVDSEKPIEVSRGIGDFVFVAPPGKE